jgi:hypothetical protein
MKLLAAVPSHSDTITIQTAQTLICLQEIVHRRGGSFRAHWEGGATVSLVRNAIAAEFLASDADVLLMLDADQGVWPATLERMIDLGKPFVGCMYPKRSYDWSKVNFETASSVQDVVYQASDFVGWLRTDAAGKVDAVDGFAPAEHVGTGVMLLTREVFSRLMVRYPELKGRGFGLDAYPRHNSSERWGFFNPANHVDGFPLSEDISFCLRWLEAGGEIWANVVDNVLHVGQHDFIGNYVDFLSATGRRA